MRLCLNEIKRPGQGQKTSPCFAIGKDDVLCNHGTLADSASLRRLSARLEQVQAQAGTGKSSVILSFDKDDVDALDFVAATANLRSLIFGIETRSKFDIKRVLS